MNTYRQKRMNEKRKRRLYRLAQKRDALDRVGEVIEAAATWNKRRARINSLRFG